MSVLVVERLKGAQLRAATCSVCKPDKSRIPLYRSTTWHASCIIGQYRIGYPTLYDKLKACMFDTHMARLRKRATFSEALGDT